MRSASLLSRFRAGIQVLGPLAGLACACDATPPPVAPSASMTAPGSAPVAAPPEPPADPSTLAVPGPAASSCTSDAMCLNHRCNLQYGKCAFPCATDADCVRGTSCFKAVISTCQPGTGARARGEPGR